MKANNSAKAAAYAISMAGPTRIGLGCMALTGVYGYVELQQAKATIRRALSTGVCLYDTAPLYANGLNEELLGEVLAGRDDVFVTTKFGLHEGKGGRLVRDSAPFAVRSSVEASLRRLRRSRIDLLLQHRQDPRTPDGEVAAVVKDLVHEGKVGAFGLSSVGVARVARMGQAQVVRAVQNALSVLSPAGVGAQPKGFAAIGAVYMAYSPLERGVLTAVTPRVYADDDDYRSRLKMFGEGEWELVREALAAVAGVARKYDVMPAAVGLAWVVARNSNVVVIPGARTPQQVDCALQAAELVLAESDLAAIDGVSAKIGALRSRRELGEPGNRKVGEGAMSDQK